MARSRGVILGTMRATRLSNPGETGHDDGGHFVKELCPALYLSRAATKADRRAKRINSLMRLYFTEAAIELGLGGIVGFLYQGASRAMLMSRMGYRFFQLHAKSKPQLRYESRCLFARLSLDTLGISATKTFRSGVANSTQRSAVGWAYNCRNFA